MKTLLLVGVSAFALAACDSSNNNFQAPPPPPPPPPAMASFDVPTGVGVIIPPDTRLALEPVLANVWEAA